MKKEKGLDPIILLITSQITETEKKRHYLVYHKSDNWNREDKFVDTEEEIRSVTRAKTLKWPNENKRQWSTKHHTEN